MLSRKRIHFNIYYWGSDFHYTNICFEAAEPGFTHINFFPQHLCEGLLNSHRRERLIVLAGFALPFTARHPVNGEIVIVIVYSYYYFWPYSILVLANSAEPDFRYTNIF